MNTVSKTYKVAGHFFRLTLPDSERLSAALSRQYDPFIVTEDIPGEDLLFSLEYTDTLEETPRECIYDVPTEDGETVVKLYREQDGWFFETSPDHRLPVVSTVRSTKDFRSAKFALASKRLTDAVFGINNAAMLLFAFASASLDTLEMHASVVENDGRGYLFLGKSGTGKSTHSSLWLKYIEGTTLMNDDNPVIRVGEDGVVRVYGSPWSGKTPCYKNVEAPIGAIVQIRRCKENKITRQNVLEAFSSLFSSISGLKDDEESMADGLNATMDKVISGVPFYVLDCRPDEEAALVCHKGVTSRD